MTRTDRPAGESSATSQAAHLGGGEGEVEGGGELWGLGGGEELCTCSCQSCAYASYRMHLILGLLES